MNMKRIGLYILLACLGIACQKEDGITPGIIYENLYAITDDPTDSIQHRRYELFEKYGVPVFFNDTVGQVFVKVDVNGDSVFRYETLDLNWAFSSTNSSTVTYHVTRITDPALQMKALRMAETYLENSFPALYPYALWLTKDCYVISSSVEQKEVVSRYRNLLFAGIDGIAEEDMPAKAKEFRNEVVKLRVQNYETQVKAFNSVTDEKYYDVRWSTLYPKEIVPHWNNPNTAWYPFGFALEKEWNQEDRSALLREVRNYGNNTDERFKMGKWTEEDFDVYNAYCRPLVGAFGFITYDVLSGSVAYTPQNTENDLTYYLEEMLKYSREEFLERWESSPLVLKKYEILYAVIRDELGVEL